MINILLSKYDIGKKWCAEKLKKYIKNDARVAVIAFSFRDEDIKNEQDWDRFYGNGGVLSNAIANSFKHYGIESESIEYIDYFRDSEASAKRKLQAADILYFPGGAADKIMSRVIKFDLYQTIENYKGVIIGFGAGAQIQLAQYHVTSMGGKVCPSLGFRFAEGFDIELNYANDESQNYFIGRVVSETGMPVYAIGDEGALIIDNGAMSAIGDVHCFRKKSG